MTVVAGRSESTDRPLTGVTAVTDGERERHQLIVSDGIRLTQHPRPPDNRSPRELAPLAYLGAHATHDHLGMEFGKRRAP